MGEDLEKVVYGPPYKEIKLYERPDNPFARFTVEVNDASPKTWFFQTLKEAQRHYRLLCSQENQSPSILVQGPAAPVRRTRFDREDPL